GSERLKIPKIANHHGELGHVDGPKLYVGNFNPVGGDGLIEIEDFPRAARDTKIASQPAIDHTVGYTSVQNKPELAAVSNTALNYDQVTCVQLKRDFDVAAGRVGGGLRVGCPKGIG